MTLKTYASRSSDLAVSFLLVLPLLLFYEIGIVLLRSPVKNAADVLLKGPLMFAGPDRVLVFNLILFLLFTAALFSLDKQRREIDGGLVTLIFAESFFYAFLLFLICPFVVFACRRLLSIGRARNLFQQIVLSVGAGVYEEILFRLVLLGLAMLLCAKVFRLSRTFSAVVSILFSSAVFALMHYLGPLGDRFTIDSFIYRTTAGTLLAVVYVTRGFGIAVYTHAIYDILVVLQRF